MGISIGAVAVGIPSSRRGSRVGPEILESIFHIKIPFRPSSLDRFTSAPLRELICT